MKKYQGFSLVEVVIILVIVTVIGAVGYVAYDRLYNPSTDEISNVQSVPETPAVSTKADLDTAATALDSADLDAAEAEITALEAELAKF